MLGSAGRSAGRLATYRAGRGPAVLLVHGWMCDSRDMLGLADRLAFDHDVVALDLRGHGESTAPAGGSYRLDDLADDLAAVVGELQLPAPIVAGHSMGGAVALAFARQQPAAVGAVLLVDAPWAITRPTPAVRASADELTGAGFAARRSRIGEQRALVLGERPPDAAEQEVAAVSFASLMEWDGPAALRACPVPVAALFSDANWRAVEPELPAFPQLVADVVAGTGHWVQVERPDVVAGAIRELGRRVTAAGRR